MRSGKRRNIRRRRTEEEEQGEDALSVREALEETKLLQQLRRREKGLTVGVGPGVVPVGTTSDGSDNERDSTKLRNTFTQQSEEVNTEDKNMMKYVELKMATKLGVEDAVEAPPERSEEDQLYHPPEHLRTEKPAEKEEDEVPGRWLTGIVEVDLPITYKLQNIEETERLKREMLEGRKDSESVGAVGVNEQRWRQAEPMKRPKEEETRDARGVEPATDEQTFDRFKKRFRFDKR